MENQDGWCKLIYRINYYFANYNGSKSSLCFSSLVRGSRFAGGSLVLDWFVGGVSSI